MSEEYITALQDAIRHMHGRAATHVDTVPLREEFNGQLLWPGKVEVFDLRDHLTGQQCYAWGYQDEMGRQQYVAVLRADPVDTPRQAIQAYVLSQQGRRKDVP